MSTLVGLFYAGDILFYSFSVMFSLVGFYGMSTLVGLFYVEEISYYSFLMGTEFFLFNSIFLNTFLFTRFLFNP